MPNGALYGSENHWLTYIAKKDPEFEHFFQTLKPRDIMNFAPPQDKEARELWKSGAAHYLRLSKQRAGGQLTSDWKKWEVEKKLGATQCAISIMFFCIRKIRQIQECQPCFGVGDYFGSHKPFLI